jgi:hypothetical protein
MKCEICTSAHFCSSQKTAFFIPTARCRWIDNIKMDLLKIGFGVVDWIGLAQDRYRWRALVNAVMNLRVP